MGFLKDNKRLDARLYAQLKDMARPARTAL